MAIRCPIPRVEGVVPTSTVSYDGSKSKLFGLPSSGNQPLGGLGCDNSQRGPLYSFNSLLKAVEEVAKAGTRRFGDP